MRTPRNVQIYQDGYIVLGGGVDTNSTYLRIYIAYIDTLGNEIWNKSIGDTIYDYYHGDRNSLIKNNSGKYSLAGTRDGNGNITAMLIIFDQNFDTLWSKYYFDNTDFTTFYNHVQTSDSGYACIGYTNEFDPDGDILLVKTDAMGNMQWYKNYGTVAKDYGFCIEQTPDNGFLIGGHTEGYGGGDGYLIKVDSLGNEEWTEHYGHPSNQDGAIYDITLTKDAGYVIMYSKNIYTVSGTWNYLTNHFIKLDQSYNIVWDRLYGAISQYTGTGSIIEVDNGDLLATVTDDHITGLFRLTADGDSIWKQYYQSPNSTGDDALLALKQTQDGGFIMAGVTYNPQQMWVVKVDSCGCDTVGCLCDNIYVEEIKHNENSLLIYPNPANEKLTIKSCGKILQIEIIDYFGRVIKTVSEIKEPEKTIDVSSLPKGLYLVRVYGEGIVKTEKFIKE